MPNEMTRSELARHLGVSRMTLWNYQRRGIIPAPRRRFSNRSIFDAAAIWSAETAVSAAKAAA